jgi:magnesium chelatase subunit I
MMNIQVVKTLGELKKNGYTPKSIKDEIRENLIVKIKAKENPFPSIMGYEDTVIPDTERALLSRHNILFLGLRGQAKTRMARQMVELLDEYIPIVSGSEINDDPLQPISRYALDLIAEKGDDTPIDWLHRSKRYGEKLATPDVSVADLIGDIDPIKAANLKLDFADERVLHYGIIPRSNRCIFVINELPDLQARIQVSLFNILEEGDLQIRGFKLRLPLDVLFCIYGKPRRLYQPWKYCNTIKR